MMNVANEDTRVESNNQNDNHNLENLERKDQK
jgi:hypothetical protein